MRHPSAVLERKEKGGRWLRPPLTLGFVVRLEVETQGHLYLAGAADCVGDDAEA
jgi:hypothetical protein